MKKLLLLSSTLMIALFVYSCKNDPDPDPQPEPEPELVYKLEVDKDELTFDCEASEVQYINVECENVEWDAAVEGLAGDWITIEQTTDKIFVSVRENIDIENRDGVILITPKTDKVAAKEIKVTQNKNGKQYDLKMTMAQLLFHGDKYEIGASNYALALYSGDPEIVYDEEWGEYNINVENGYLIYLDMITSTLVIPDEYQNPRLMAGTYNCSKSISAYEHMTFMKTSFNEDMDMYNNSLIVNHDKGKQKIDMINAGNVRIDHRGDVYIITFELTMPDGTILSGFYKKELDLIHNYVSNSTLKENLELNNLTITEGNLHFYGIDPNTGYHSWVIEMVSEGLTIKQGGFLVGTGYYIALDVYAPASTSTTVLPDGTYAVTNKSSEYTAYPGFIDWYMDFGCHVIRIEENQPVEKVYLVSGHIDIKNNSGNKYIFDIDTESDLYYKVDIECTSDLTYIDSSAGL